MPLKLVCPNCRADVRLTEPLPLPGAAVQCERCATAIAVTYPPGVMDQLKGRGKRFAEPAAASRPVQRSEPAATARSTPPPAAQGVSGEGRFLAGSSMGTRSTPKPPAASAPQRHTPVPGAPSGTARRMNSHEPQPVSRNWPPSNGGGHHEDGPSNGFGRHSQAATVPDEPTRERPSPDILDRTVGSLRTPYGGLPNNVPEHDADPSRSPTPATTPRGKSANGADSRSRNPAKARGSRPEEDDDSNDPPETQRAPMVKTGQSPASRKMQSPTPPSRGSRSSGPPPAKPKKRSRLGAVTGAVGCLGSVGFLGVGGLAVVALLAVMVAGGGYWHFSRQLPTVETLRAYRPPTVTVVEDAKGQILGEIFEEKRYVVPTDEIPLHVKQAFLAAEDANFYGHGGIDYMGIVRAMGRNALKGRFAQGASTITQQVAKNFLLTTDKTLVRKSKEVILSWRIEEAYEKDHILFLYLNEIFLGAQSYGVEAASRTYFGKHVQDITIAEAAILAGLPQRPSDYSPYKGWDKARARQEYVIEQMLAKEFITQAQADAALAEDVKVMSRENKFRSKAPWFTEHVRRYLVDKYGEDRVLHEGLLVKTTCDLDLQTLGQTAVKDGVYDADWRMGYRRTAAKNVGKANIAATRDAQEKKLRENWAEEQDPAGRVAVPAKSVLEPGKLYDAVVVDAKPKFAVLGIGAHDAMLTTAMNDWMYEPDTTRSWRGRAATDLTALVDTDGDKKRDTAMMMPGDVVKVKIEALSTRDAKVAKGYAGSPGETGEYVAVTMFQIPEVESALMSMDLATGAIRTMVGGSDFDKSEFNRAIQARRQVGSTYKPIVYAAAIESKRVTAASMFADAPLAMATSNDFVWKPSNYSNDYEGNMTMRTALQKSKNTCTVRVLDAADPGMNDDVIYKFGRRLGIGGPPTHRLPADYVPTPKNDVLCPWVKEEPDFKLCMDRYPPMPEGLTDSQHRAKLKPGDEYWCRACDYSMGLGSASLTMEEMVRAYSPFPTGGKLIEPYYVEEVSDRDGNILEKHEVTPPAQVMDPAVASIATWLLEGVVRGGTASDAGRELGLKGLGGKTGTTNDEKDAWFVGFTNDVITAVWFGYDQPQTLGMSSTGGRTALPVWIRYMKAAADKSKDREFPVRGQVDYALIDEATGRRVTSGGVSYPFLAGTVPEGTGLEAGQISIDDLNQLQ